MSTILIVDDDRTTRKGLYFILKFHSDHIFEAENIKQADACLNEREYDLVISDLRLPNEENGLALVRKIKQKHPLTPVLMITAYGSVNSAVEAMKAGADDFVTKDFSREEIVIKINKMLETRKLWLSNLRLAEQVNSFKKFSSHDTGDQIIGESPRIKEILQLIVRVAKDKDATVLITGESGSGKELVAKAIHQTNPIRKDNNFVVVDVANMPATLLESQLFGHEKGAFTNAIQKHIGYFEIADKGTAFLDEIGDFPLELQIKLLRFLQEKTFNRVGGEKTIYSDTRIVAATNKDLSELMAKQRFREDLFYRLNVISIHIPSLRERREDIPLLIDYFKNKFEWTKGRVLLFPESVIRHMTEYNWPGNIRQLKNFIERLFILCPHEEVRLGDLNFEQTPKNSDDFVFGDLLQLSLKDARQELIRNFERVYLKHYLELYNNNISKLATAVGESRESLSKKIKKYALKTPSEDF
ncbi:MAG: sigma-54-dependent Fis family transcriptional regulator [Deferribacteres bacterium]|nr:sigma-54-dependent Fis family transcriptional regulator [candidate division KSB1 bacterium]MCB9504159.1 sigma-54-dependent Fis family transcriptional regulator [Deferribacteres bacterium]